MLLATCWGTHKELGNQFENPLGTHWEQKIPTPPPHPPKEKKKKKLGHWVHASLPHCLPRISMLASII